MRDMVMALVSAFFLLMFLLMTQGCSDPTPQAYPPPLPHTRKAGGWSPCCWSPVQLALLEQTRV